MTTFFGKLDILLLLRRKERSLSSRAAREKVIFHPGLITQFPADSVAKGGEKWKMRGDIFPLLHLPLSRGSFVKKI